MAAENPSNRPTAESLLELSLFEEKHAVGQLLILL